jgi:hypothetical protein
MRLPGGKPFWKTYAYTIPFGKNPICIGACREVSLWKTYADRYYYMGGGYYPIAFLRSLINVDISTGLVRMSAN